MKNNNVSGISLQEIDHTISALKELRQRMPFLVTLSPVERRRGSRVGAKQVLEAVASLQAAREQPGILAATFEMAQFEQTVQAMACLHHCRIGLKNLASDVQDTLASVAVRGITGTQQVRAMLKAAAKTTPGLKQLALSLATGSRRGPAAASSASTAVLNEVEATPPSPPRSETGPRAPRDT